MWIHGHLRRERFAQIWKYEHFDYFPSIQMILTLSRPPGTHCQLGEEWGAAGGVSRSLLPPLEKLAASTDGGCIPMPLNGLIYRRRCIYYVPWWSTALHRKQHLVALSVADVPNNTLWKHNLLEEPLTGCLCDCFTDWLTNWLWKWRTDSQCNRLTDWLIHCENEWLFYCLTDSDLQSFPPGRPEWNGHTPFWASRGCLFCSPSHSCLGLPSTDAVFLPNGTLKQQPPCWADKQASN